jgi:hypothetical protein
MRSVFRERPDALELRARVAGWGGKAWVWLPVVVGLIVIAIESTDTFSAAHTDGWIRPLVERMLGHINDTVWYWIHRAVRKSGHFGGYGLMCLTLLRAWLLTLALQADVRWWKWRSVGLAVVGTFCVAGLDEWHQTYIPSRTGRFQMCCWIRWVGR